MKECSRCNESKAFKEFRANAKRKDGLSVWCRSCFAAYDRERYQNGDNLRKIANLAKTTERNRDFIWKVLSTHPCVDCGEADPLVLEFDHKDDVIKVDDLSVMTRYRSIKAITEEIAKCDVRCANCHRRRTIKQFDFWKGRR
jgi:hypothetical protein